MLTNLTSLDLTVSSLLLYVLQLILVQQSHHGYHNVDEPNLSLFSGIFLPTVCSQITLVKQNHHGYHIVDKSNFS